MKFNFYLFLFLPILKNNQSRTRVKFLLSENENQS